MDFNPAYVGSRQDIAELLEGLPTHILDVGCSTGSLGANLKRRFPTAQITGIEYDAEMAQVAKDKLDEVIVADLDRPDWIDKIAHRQFDLILCADVLEHLRNPGNVLLVLQQVLTPEGRLIVSLPNVRHWSVIYQLLIKGDWPLTNSGIFDRTHLRFFTKSSARRLVEKSGLQIEKIVGKHPFYELTGTFRQSVGRTLGYFPGVREFIAHQWILICRK